MSNTIFCKLLPIPTCFPWSMKSNNFVEYVSRIVSHIASISTRRMREVGSMTYRKIYLPSSTKQLYKLRTIFIRALMKEFLPVVFAQHFLTKSKTHASGNYLHVDVPKTTTEKHRHGMRLLVYIAFNSISQPPIPKELQNRTTTWSWVHEYSVNSRSEVSFLETYYISFA